MDLRKKWQKRKILNNESLNKGVVPIKRLNYKRGMIIMEKTKISTFEVVLLFVGVITAALGFKLIKQVYNEVGDMSWLMLIAIFSWLTLLILFISLSLNVDISKKQLAKMEFIVYLLNKKKGRKE